jgi:hypothetical protein
LGSLEYIACGRRSRYVLRILGSEVHPTRGYGLKHFFGRSGVRGRSERMCQTALSDLFDAGKDTRADQRHTGRTLVAKLSRATSASPAWPVGAASENTQKEAIGLRHGGLRQELFANLVELVLALV